MVKLCLQVNTYICNRSTFERSHVASITAACVLACISHCSVRTYIRVVAYGIKRSPARSQCVRESLLVSAQPLPPASWPSYSSWMQPCPYRTIVVQQHTYHSMHTAAYHFRRAWGVEWLDQMLSKMYVPTGFASYLHSMTGPKWTLPDSSAYGGACAKSCDIDSLMAQLACLNCRPCNFETADEEEEHGKKAEEGSMLQEANKSDRVRHAVTSSTCPCTFSDL